jgi:hypothetical protein
MLEQYHKPNLCPPTLTDQSIVYAWLLWLDYLVWSKHLQLLGLLATSWGLAVPSGCMHETTWDMLDRFSWNFAVEKTMQSCAISASILIGKFEWLLHVKANVIINCNVNRIFMSLKNELHILCLLHIWCHWTNWTLCVQTLFDNHYASWSQH